MTSELLSMVTSDGRELRLDAYGGDIKFLVVGGFGMPPVEHVTHRGYKQMGATSLATVAQPRVVTAQMWHKPACSRAAYWQARREILDFFAANRGGPLLLVVQLPSNALRCIYVRPTPGAIFPSVEPGASIWNIQEGLQFEAFDPIWFDPTPVEFNLTAGITQAQLVFPITFPITFGFNGPVFSSGAITYRGNWPAFMWFRIQGPYTFARLVNETTGAQILLNVAIGEDDYRVVDLRDPIAITDPLNNSAFAELGSQTDFANFALQPAPTGAQTFKVYLENGTAQSALYLAYFNRFVGI